MRILVFLIFLQFCLFQNLFALNSGNVLEIRSTASNSALQGCFFNPTVASPGTDYSQQDDAQVTYTDIVIDASDPRLITSAANPFTSDHAGNGIRFTSGAGFITGSTNWFIIESVSGNTATLDRGAGTLGSTGGNGRLGGACEPNNTLADEMFESLRASDTVYIKGNNIFGEAVSISGNQGDSKAIKVIGYNSVRGDNPLIGEGQPQINLGSNQHSSGQNYNYSNIEFTGTGITMLQIGVSGIFKNTKISNTSSSVGRIAVNNNAGGKLISSAVTSPNGIGMGTFNSGAMLFGSIIYNSSICVNITNVSNVHLIGNIFSFCNSTGAILAAGSNGNSNYAIGNTIYCSSPTSSTGISIGNPAPTGRQFVVNNIIANCNTAIDFPNELGTISIDNNNLFGNTVNFSSSATNLHINTTFLNPQFTSTSSWETANFSVGTNMRGLGIPRAFANFASTGAIDMGAVQRRETTRGIAFSQ